MDAAVLDAQPIHEALDRVTEILQKDGAKVFIRELTNVLGGIRSRLRSDLWGSIAIPTARAHPVMSLVQQCPMTRHSFSKPRGYAGDADLLDIIYRHNSIKPLLDNATELGSTICDFASQVSSCRSVVYRREMIARRIDEIAKTRNGCEVLAVACGHLREAELSDAIKSGSVARLVATDQDEQSLLVAQSYAMKVGNCVSTARLSVKDFIRKRHELAYFDLIYAAGLYDYLDAKTASRLTSRLFDLLKPGGRLLLGNFLDGLWEIPYMETYMDWRLIHRTEDEIKGFASEIDPGNCASNTYYADPMEGIGYLELERA
jgi:extracellular factor (EF) 3-hydroxypalmitic acid methyl ester biosynthesis protein